MHEFFFSNLFLHSFFSSSFFYLFCVFRSWFWILYSSVCYTFTAFTKTHNSLNGAQQKRYEKRIEFMLCAERWFQWWWVLGGGDGDGRSIFFALLFSSFLQFSAKNSDARRSQRKENGESDKLNWSRFGLSIFFLFFFAVVFFLFFSDSFTFFMCWENGNWEEHKT